MFPPSSSGHGEHASASASASVSSAAVDRVHVQRAQPAGVGAVDLRAKLEQFLGQHAILTVRLTRARLRGDGDLAQAADAALSKNSQDMGGLIGSVYGAEAGDTFQAKWFSHVTLLFDYARGVADDDKAVRGGAGPAGRLRG